MVFIRIAYLIQYSNFEFPQSNSLGIFDVAEQGIYIFTSTLNNQPTAEAV